MKHAYRDPETGNMVERDYTAAEIAAEEEVRRLDATNPSIVNLKIKRRLLEIDAATPRALREATLTLDNSRVIALEQEAIELRKGLIA